MKGMNAMSTKSFVTTLAAGLVVGAIAGMMVDPIDDKTHKKMYKSKNNMFKTIGTLVDNIMDM